MKIKMINYCYSDDVAVWAWYGPLLRNLPSTQAHDLDAWLREVGENWTPSHRQHFQDIVQNVVNWEKGAINGLPWEYVAVHGRKEEKYEEWVNKIFAALDGLSALPANRYRGGHASLDEDDVWAPHMLVEGYSPARYLHTLEQLCLGQFIHDDFQRLGHNGFTPNFEAVVKPLLNDEVMQINIEGGKDQYSASDIYFDIVTGTNHLTKGRRVDNYVWK